MLKVNFFDKKVRAIFYRYTTGITGAIAAIVLFWDIPVEYKNPAGIACGIILFVSYIIIWIVSN